MGGWVGGWGKIKIKDHLSPAEAETGAELGNTSYLPFYDKSFERLIRKLIEIFKFFGDIKYN